MFYLKQLVSVWTDPVAIVFVLAFVGMACRLIGRRRSGNVTLAFAVLAAYAASAEIGSGPLIRPLETRYPAIGDDDPLPDVGYVVVLGNDYFPDEQLPITATIAPEGLLRIVEGVRLVRRLPNARLVLTGGMMPNRGQPSLGNARIARSLGVAEEAIVVLANALDTAGEARDVRQFLGDAPFLLVTSAAHMPRAMQLMDRAGANPIAAPTGHRTEHHPEGSIRWLSFAPSAGNLATTDLALHEYLGLAAIALALGEPATLD
jgi:uncharacterized SAM-binding protein YcdF (DUF218 family)